MSTVLVVTADLQGDPSDLIRAFQQAEKASREFASQSDNDSKKASGAWDSMKSGAAKLAGALAVYFSAQVIKDFVSEAITQAGNLQQSVGAVDAVFKESSAQVHAWAKGAAEDVGLSTDAYNNYASLIGTQMKTAGFDIDEAASRTNKLIGVAADLSSMFGGTTADAVSSLSAAFRGEFDSVEKYGLALKEGDIQARLSAKGLGDLTGEAARNARAVELQAMIMEQSVDSIGNFAKESDTLQGQQQRLTAEFENAQAEIGTNFLPVMTSLAQMLRDILPPALQAVQDGFRIGGEVVQNVTGFFEDNMATIAPMAAVLGTVAAAWGIYAVVVNAATIATNVVSGATKVWTGVMAVFNAVMNANPIMLIITAIGLLVAAIIWVATQTTFFQDAWAAVSEWFIGVWTAISEFFTGLWEGIVAAVTGAWNSIVAFLTPVFEFIAAVIQTYIDIWVNIFLVMAAILVTIWNAIVAVVTTVWQAIVDFITPIVNAISAVITSVIGAIVAWWTGVWTQVSSFFNGVWQGMVDFFQPIINRISAVISAVVASIRAVWTSTWNTISSFFSSIWNNMVTAVSNAVNKVFEVVGKIKTNVMNVLNGVGTWLVETGKNLIQGFWNGIDSMWSWITSQIGGFFDGIVGWAKDTLGIASPSKVFKKLGEYTGEGFAIGLKGTTKQVISSADSMIKKLREAMSAKAISQRTGNSLISLVSKETARIRTAISQREAVLKKLKTAQDDYAKLVDERDKYADTVHNKVVDMGDVTKGGKSATSIIANLKAQVEKAKAFQTTIAELKKMGLDQTSLDQLMSQFMSTGSTVAADAIKAGGKDAVKEIVSLQKQLDSTGKTLGTTMAATMYQSGIDAAAGMVKGLQSQAAALAKAGAGIGNALVASVKKALKIKSPSRVMMDVAYDTSAGVVEGLDTTRKSIVDASANLVPVAPDPKALTSAWNPNAGMGTYGIPPWISGASAGQTTGGSPTEIKIDIKVEAGNEPDIDALIDRLVNRLRFELGGVVGIS
ncbi:tape measure protein [Microbacterium phage ValentiniPuff]|uniref:Tape measure protein n=1 Tax=Microbacterium phage ValentiniPuff TaxID=2315705 RepID=A0A386KPS3_9CAUD|nr:tape measure protein [Microbacterium phage ValentiniPuff]